MRTIWLLRHAEASLHSPSGRDLDRPLTQEGCDTAEMLADILKNSAVSFEKILCSPAQRACHTLAFIKQSLDIGDHAIVYDEQLYLADIPTLLRLLRQQPAHVNSLLIVGHNPGLQNLIEYFKPEGDNWLMLPGSLAKLTSDSEWKNIDRGNIEAVRIMHPQELTPQ